MGAREIIQDHIEESRHDETDDNLSSFQTVKVVNLLNSVIRKLSKQW